MRREQLLRTQPCVLGASPYKEKILAVAQLITQPDKKRPDGIRRIIEIDFFRKDELKVRYFADKWENARCAWICDKCEWKTLNTSNCALAADGLPPEGNWGYYRSNLWSFDEASAALVTSYFGTYVEWWENAIGANAYARKEDRRRYHVAQIMNRVPALPEEAKVWARSTFFPHDYGLITTDKDGESTLGCTLCGKIIQIDKKTYKHGKDAVCPECGGLIRIRKGAEEISRSVAIQVIQAMPETKEWVLRQFYAKAKWSVDKKVAVAERFLEFHETVRVILQEGADRGIVYRGLLHDAEEHHQEWDTKNPLNHTFHPSTIWPGNLDEVAPAAGMEHLQLKKLVRAGKLNFNTLILIHNDIPWLEYIIKAGLTNMAVEIINDGLYASHSDFNTNGTTLKELLQIDGNRLFRLKKANGGIRMLRWLRFEAEKGIKINDALMKELASSTLDISTVEELLEFTDSLQRTVNYAKKQAGKTRTLRGVMIEWRDYLTMAYEDGYDVCDDIVIFPREMKARHDALVDERNRKRDEERMKREATKYEELDAKISAQIQSMQRLDWQGKRFLFIQAQTCRELVNEGRTLHHCVGASTTYMDKMAQGTTWIVFMRHIEEPEIPYYTIEIDLMTLEVKQFYSEYDRQPDRQTVKAAIDKWVKHIKEVKGVTDGISSDHHSGVA